MSHLHHPVMSVDPHHAFGPFSAWHRPLDDVCHSGGEKSAYSTESYTYSSRTGDDGRPIVRESRHAVSGQGKFRQEEYELRDGDRREHGTARAIGDRSVVTKTVARGSDAPEETHTAYNNMNEGDAGKFDAEWGSADVKAPALMESRHPSRQAIKGR